MPSSSDASALAQAEVVERGRPELVADPPQLPRALSRASSWASASASASPGSMRSRTRFSSSTTAVRFCPIWSCSSCAIRRPLGLLGCQHPVHARPPLALQPVERRVERRDHGGDLCGGRRVEAPPRLEDVDDGHQLGEPAQGPQAEADKPGVCDQHDQQPDGEHHELALARLGIDRDRCDDEEEDRDRQDGGVHGEHAPVEADPRGGRVGPFQRRAAIVPAAVQRRHLHPRADPV